MELIRLNKKTHAEEASYIGYDSLVWNERYQDHGDFSMTSYDIKGVHDFIEQGDLVTVPDSATFCIVEEFSYDLQENGTLRLDVVGRTADCIFEYRPLLAQFAATTSPDRQIEEFGDPLETNIERFLLPSTLFGSIMSIIDGSLLESRPETKYLKLPFNYGLLAESETIHEERVASFNVDNGNTWEALTSLMELGRFHISAIRPGSEPYGEALDGIAKLYKRVHEKPLPVSQHLDLVAKYPTVIAPRFPEYKAEEIIFSSGFDDYQSASNTMSIATDNIRFRSYEDGVVESVIGYEKPVGIDARLVWEEVNIEKSTQWEWDRELTSKFTHQFASDYVNASSFSLGTKGVYPFNDKKFSMVPGEGHFYLGDVVRIEFPWGVGYNVIVEEFIRTADSSGYQEYPTFRHFVTTDNFMGEKKTISSMPYHTANRSLVDHKDWL